MTFYRRDLFLLMALVSAVSPACGQTVAAASAVAGGSESAASIPDFSGVWHRWLRPGFGPPASGPGPVTNRSRVRGVSNYNQLVGDYTNPILNREAAEVVKAHDDLSLKGIGYPTPSNQCWPDGVPYIFWQYGMQMLQDKDKVTILYLQDHQFRQVRLRHRPGRKNKSTLPAGRQSDRLRSRLSRQAPAAEGYCRGPGRLHDAVDRICNVWKAARPMGRVCLRRECP
jgi:hypothetical protein